MNLADVIRGRSYQQDNFTQESRPGVVMQVYNDSNGNTTSADVLLHGYQRTAKNVSNQSGLKLYVGMPVSVNPLQGNKHLLQVTSSVSGGATAGNNETLANSSGAAPVNPSSTGPVVLEEESNGFPYGFIFTPGSNLFETIQQAIVASAGIVTPGALILDMRLSIYTALPNPLTTTQRYGTLALLINSYWTVLGLYMLDTTVPEWRLLFSGASGGANAPIYWEQPLVGTVNGANTSFNLPITPLNGFAVYADGVRVHKGVDYTYTPPTTLSFVNAPINIAIADIQ